MPTPNSWEFETSLHEGGTAQSPTWHGVLNCQCTGGGSTPACPQGLKLVLAHARISMFGSRWGEVDNGSGLRLSVWLSTA